MAKLIDITGKAISGEWGTDDLVGNGVPVLRTTNFSNIGVVNFNNVVTRQIVKKSISEKLLRYGDIIIEKSGGSDKQPVGRVVFFEGEDNKYLFNNFTGLLRVRDFCKWNPKYIFYSLFANYAKGGTIPFENRTTGLHNLQTDSYVNSVMIMERKIEEQTDIVTILDKVNQLINYEKKQLEDLDILVKSRFIEMFGDPVTNEKWWVKVRLADKCCIITGNTPPRANEKYYGSYIEWIKSDNITSSMYLTKAAEYLSEEGLAVGKKVESGSVLMTCIAGSLKSIGNVAIADRPVTFNQQINAVVTNEQNTLFMYEQFKLTKEYITCDVNMALKGILSKGQLSEKQFIFPPIELQNQFADFVAQVDKSKLAIQKSLDELETLKKSLMQQYFG